MACSRSASPSPPPGSSSSGWPPWRLASPPRPSPIRGSRAPWSGITIFVEDLQVLGLWVIGYGVIGAALATASAPRHAPVDARIVWNTTHDRLLGWTPTTTSARVWRAVLIIAAGIVLVLERRHALLPLAVALVGAYVVYLGRCSSWRWWAAPRPAHRVPARRSEPRASRHLPLGGGGRATILVLLTAAGVGATVAARRHVGEAAERRCNGSAELCDRTSTGSRFAGTHNSMSSTAKPGWLFAEQSTASPPSSTTGSGPCW